MGKYDNFNQEVREKADLVKHSRKHPPHKKGGGGLPSEKEMHKKDGLLVRYALNKPMTRGEFAALPRESKKAYLKNLINTYQVGAGAIATMLGYEQSTIFRLLRQFELSPSKSLSLKAVGENNKRFLKEFCGIDTPKKAEENQALALQEISLSLTGPFSAAALAQAVAQAIPEGQICKISITVALDSANST